MQKSILIRMLKFFLEDPYQEVYLRQLSKKLKISVFATKKYADLLVRENIINEERKANLRYFRANSNNLFYKHLKIAFNINLILKSGLIEFLNENIPNISAIILFGSIARGEDDKKSDMDILIMGKKEYLNLNEFEEKVNKKITLHIFSWSEWNVKSKEDSAFYFDVMSQGIPLYGELPLVKWK